MKRQERVKKKEGKCITNEGSDDKIMMRKTHEKRGQIYVSQLHEKRQEETDNAKNHKNTS